MKTNWLIFLALMFTFQSRAQIIWELPKNVRYDLEKSLLYTENKLKDVLLNPDERMQLLCIQSQLFNKKGLFAKAEKILLDIKSPKIYSVEAQISYYLAKAINEKYRDNPEMAALDYDRAIALAKDSKDPYRQMEIMVEKAEYHRRFTQFEVGLELVESVLQNLEKKGIGATEVKAYALNRKAALMNESGSGNQMIEVSLECIRLAKKVNNYYLMAASFNELGFLFKNVLKVDSSYYYYTQAEMNFRAGNMLLDAMQAWFNRLEMMVHNGYRLNEAIAGLRSFVTEYEEKDIEFPMRMAFLYLAEHAEKEKNYEDATLYWKKYNDAVAKEFQVQSMIRMENLKQEFENSKVIEENKRMSSELNRKQEEIKRKDTRIAWIIVGLLVVIGGFFVSVRLYARTRKLSKRLQVQNEQKDFLIQEVHHRVKNNLHFIHSLLEMQKNSTDNIEVAVGLEEASQRISCVSLVHEFLFQGEQYDKVKISDYIAELMQHLETTYQIEAQKVEVKLNIAAVEFSIQNCTALGLLISELYTNSIKHAFQELETPKFSVEFKKVDFFNSYELVIRDNGPKEIQLDPDKKRKTLGMRLIDIFSRQLKGDYQIGWENGFYYKLNFVLDEG